MSLDRGMARADVVLITPDLAMGQALATACSDHAIDLRVVDSGAGEVHLDGDVVVLDLLVDDPAMTAQSAALVKAEIKGKTNRLLVLAGGPVRIVSDIQVTGWLTPDLSVEAFVAAVADSPAVSRRLRASEIKTTDALTARERAVLAELLAGHDNTLIAVRLDISEHTVRTHLQNILAKLGVSSRSEAASWALRSGVTPADRAEEVAS